MRSPDIFSQFLLSFFTNNGFFSFLYLSIRYFTDERFEDHTAHPFYEFDAAYHKVSATADTTPGYLVSEFPYHPGDIHEYTP
jgi:hypothetical protein